MSSTEYKDFRTSKEYKVFRKRVLGLIAGLLEVKSRSGEMSLSSEREYLEEKLEIAIGADQDAKTFIADKTPEHKKEILREIINQALRKRRVSRRYYITGC